MAKDTSNEARSISTAYAALPAERRRQFRERLREKGIASDRLPVVPLCDRGEVFPLSWAQERLWFLWCLEPESASYNLAEAVRLTGEIDVDAVRRAVQALVARHEVLGLRFRTGEDGSPQQIAGNANFAWSEPDLSQEPESLRADVLASLLSQRSHEPFDLERGPLLRVSLVKLAPHEHVLHFALHHIVSDAWSLGILTREFARTYTGTCAGTCAALHAGVIDALPPLPVQYGDYAAWQREWLDEARLDAQLRYWRE
uniref:condensation domain-containing protein n=1 Tax=Paraburkholderia ferrariae TaxID=386056 RepID=UPI0004837170